MRPKSQEIAKARALILSAAADYIRGNGLGRRNGRAVFCRLYLERGIPGIPQEIYKRVRLVSRATLELWGKAFNRGGLVGLAPRTTNSGRDSKLTPEAMMMLRACLAQKPDAGSRYILTALRANFPAEDVPHKANVNRWLKKWREGNKAEDALNRNPIEYKSGYGSHRIPPQPPAGGL